MNRHPYREGFTVDVWRERFSRALSTRFGLRLHMTAVLALVLGSGVLTARVLRSLTTSMPLRYAIATLVAYGVFFVVLRVWARFLVGSLQAEAPTEVLPPMASVVVQQIGVPDESATKSAGSSSAWIGDTLNVDVSFHGSSGGAHGQGASVNASSGASSFDAGSASSGDASGSSSSGGSSGGSLDVDGEGFAAIIVIALLAIVVMVVLGAAVWCVWEAPVILSEVVFEVVLATALARAARRAPDRGWSRALLSHTWKPALVVLVVAVVSGAGVQAACPAANTMREALRMCVFEQTTTRGVAR
jgi:hypothetical protein